MFAALRHRTTRLQLLLPLLFVMVLRGLLPSGFMPVVDAQGQLRVALCSDGLGAWAQAVSAAAGAATPAPAADPNHQPCPFSAATVATPPPALTLLLPAYTLLATVAAAPVSVALPGLTPRVQTARGPPVRV